MKSYTLQPSIENTVPQEQKESGIKAVGIWFRAGLKSLMSWQTVLSESVHHGMIPSSGTRRN